MVKGALCNSTTPTPIKKMSRGMYAVLCILALLLLASAGAQHIYNWEGELSDGSFGDFSQWAEKYTGAHPIVCILLLSCARYN